MTGVFRDARSGIEVIDRDGCLELLAGESIGRLAVIAGAEPVIFPVNSAVHEGRIVFRSAPGSKLTAVVWGSKACFEIDRFDPLTGWHFNRLLRMPAGGSGMRAFRQTSSLNACGICSSTPAPSPVLISQPQAPRWSRFFRTWMACSRMRCDL